MHDTTATDPRVLRTRQLLYQAFVELLGEKRFEDISVADVTKRSTLNRATFYKHFTDKFALLESMIGDDFQAVLDARMTGAMPCRDGLRRMILAVCDFFVKLRRGCDAHRKQFQPIAEARTREMVGDFLIKAMAKHEVTGRDAALRATMASWAICGAALDWCQHQEGTVDELAESAIPKVDFVLWGAGSCPG
jgi:AcrR family transcriptional regulator